LPIKVGHITGNNRGKCAKSCASKGSSFYGIQSGNECFCSKGDAYGKYGETTGCTCDNPKHKGHWRNCIYTVPGVPARGKFIGCFNDKRKRDLPVRKGSITGNDRGKCAKRCATTGASFYGIQSSNACFCSKGEEFGKYGEATTGCTCDNPKHKGHWRNCIYSVPGN